MDHYHSFFSKLTSTKSRKKTEVKFLFKLNSLSEFVKVMIEVEASILQTKFDLRYLDSDASTLNQAKNQFQNLKYFFDNVLQLTIDRLQEVFEVIDMLFEKLSRCQCTECQPLLEDNLNDYYCSFNNTYHVVELNEK